MHTDNHRTVLARGEALIHSSNDADNHSKSKPSSQYSSLQIDDGCQSGQSTDAHTGNRSMCLINPSTKTASVSKPLHTNQDVRIVMPRKHQDRLLPDNTSMGTSKQASKDVTQKHSCTSSSLEYKNRLEEMELRIRYMRNDIEFKQGQINSKEEAKTKQQVLRRDKPQAIWKTSVSQPHSSASSLPPHWTQNHGRERFSLSQNNITRTFNKGQRVEHRHQPNPVQTPFYISHSKEEVTHLSTSPLSSSISAVEAASSSSMPLPSVHTSSCIEPVTCSVPKSNFQPSSYQATFSQKPYQRNIYTSQQQTGQTSTIPAGATPLPMKVSSIDTINPHHHRLTTNSISPYKMVKPKTPTINSTIPATSGLSTLYFTENKTSNIPEDYSTTPRVSTAENVFNIPPDTTQKRFLSRAHLVKRHTPLQVQTAARLVCSKYKLKRLSPTSVKSFPRFPTHGDTRTFMKSVPQQLPFHMGTSSPGSISKYKLVKPKDASNPVLHTLNLTPASSLNASDNELNQPSICNVNVNPGNEISSAGVSFPNTIIQGNNGRKRRLSFKSTAKHFHSLKFQRMKTVIPTLGSRSLSYIKNQSSLPRLAHSSSYPGVPSSLKPVPSQWKKSVFKLDKRGVENQASSKVSTFKLDKRLVRNSNHHASVSPSHSSPRYNRKHRQSLKREASSNLYKWRPGQIFSTKSNHKNTSSLYKWQRHPFNLQPKSSQIRHQSAFKWHRQNSCNTNVTRRQLEMAKLKQRLKVIMSHRNASTSKWLMSSRGVHSHPHAVSLPPSSPIKGRGKGVRKEEVNRLVMIGHMLYKASCRKLTRADPGTALTRESSPSVNGSHSSGYVNRKAGPTSGSSTCLSGSPLSSSSSSPHLYRQTTVMSPKKKLPGSVIVKSLRPQKMKLVTVRGVRFHVESNGTKLSRVDDKPGHKQGQTNMSRVDIGGMTYVKTGPHTLELSSQGNKKLAASRAVYKSLSIVTAKQRKTANRIKTSKQKHCVFFRRFGKCQRGDKCPFIHDPDKVAVCTRFLRGQCNDRSVCPFSHDASVHKMPVCLFYLQGLCAREDCLYLHVNVSPDAPVCNDFLQGFCPLGLKCKKLHSFVCPCYAVFGKCPRRDKCSLLHRQSKKQTDTTWVSKAGAGNSKTRSFSKTKDKISVISDNDNQVGVSDETSSETKTTLAPPNLLSSSSSSSSSFPSPSKETLSKTTGLSSLQSSPLSSYLSSSSPSSLSSPSPLSHISSFHPTPSSDSALKAQPSFISLLPISSSIPALPKKQSSSVPSLPTSPTLTSYKSPKITPQFSKPKAEKSNVESSLQCIKKDHDVVRDTHSQDFLSLTSVPSASACSPLLSSSSLSTKSSLSSETAVAATVSTLGVPSPCMPLTSTSTMAAISSLSSRLSSASSPISSIVCPRDEKKESTSQPLHQSSNDLTIDKTPKDYYSQDILKFDLESPVVESSQQTSLPNDSLTSTTVTSVESVTVQNSEKQLKDIQSSSLTFNRNDSLLVFSQESDISKNNPRLSSSPCDDAKAQSPTSASSSVFNKGIIPSFMTRLMKFDKK